ncbi:hypothetical protein ACFWR9_11195 [Streptomyces sp. NPDC058534]|uniref:hypothetical protein n=1 Tax=Streptomyces sp. NPDC058534 TaxID=3346541 RepID=UPI00364B2BA0
MSEVVLRIQPGESEDDFTSRIASAAPSGLTAQLAARLRTLLAIEDRPAEAPAARQSRAAA